MVADVRAAVDERPARPQVLLKGVGDVAVVVVTLVVEPGEEAVVPKSAAQCDAGAGRGEREVVGTSADPVAGVDAAVEDHAEPSRADPFAQVPMRSHFVANT